MQEAVSVFKKAKKKMDIKMMGQKTKNRYADDGSVTIELVEHFVSCRKQ